MVVPETAKLSDGGILISNDDFGDSSKMSNLMEWCSDLLGGSWSDVNNFQIELYPTLYTAMLNNVKSTETSSSYEPTKVLIRIFGDSSSRDVDSLVSSSVVFTIFSEQCIGPKLLGIFPGGRIEQFVPSRTLTTDELSHPIYYEEIARHFAMIHSIRAPLSKKANGFRNFLDRMKFALANSTTLPPPYKGTLEDWTRFRVIASKYNVWEEYDWLKSKLFDQPEEKFPVVFCHNDLHHGNILLLQNPSKSHRLMPIDFDFSSYNYRGFDIGNYFNEWCLDYSLKTRPFFTYNSEKYPNRTEQMKFWMAYLEAFGQSTFQAADVDGKAVDVASCFNQLWLESFYGSLYSHHYWGVWTLLQSVISDKMPCFVVRSPMFEPGMIDFLSLFASLTDAIIR